VLCKYYKILALLLSVLLLYDGRKVGVVGRSNIKVTVSQGVVTFNPNNRRKFIINKQHPDV